MRRETGTLLYNTVWEVPMEIKNRTTMGPISSFSGHTLKGNHNLTKVSTTMFSVALVTIAKTGTT